MKPFLFIAGLWICGFAAREALPEINLPSNAASDHEAIESNSTASLLGEFGSGLSSYLWLKTDDYVHGGMLLRSMTQSEKERKLDRATSADGIVRHEGYETGVTPTKTNDFRGLWGDIEGNVKPFYDLRSHKHRDPSECLPLYRFMTWADPTFVQGYMVGAQVINGAEGADAAVAFLEEGLRYNPKSISHRIENARYRVTRRNWPR